MWKGEESLEIKNILWIFCDVPGRLDNYGILWNLVVLYGEFYCRGHSEERVECSNCRPGIFYAAYSFCNISAFFGPTPGRYMMERLSRSSIYKYLFCKQRLCHQQIERSRNLYIFPVSRNSLDRMPPSLHNRSIVGKQF